MRIARTTLICCSILASSLLAAGAPAWAAPPVKTAAANPAEADEKEIARSIELGGLVFPVFDEKGRLQNYIFVNARMLVGPGKDPWRYRERAHFVRDAVLRAAHRTSFGVKGDSSKLDEQLAIAECIRVANEVLGESNALVSMTFTQIASQAGRQPGE
jgi:hypothetical protein